MKSWKKLLVFASCVALACFVLAGCQQAEPAPPQNDAKELDVKDERSNEPFYVLVVGNDSRTGTTEINDPMYSDGKGRSDTTMLVRVDPATYQVGIVTVPRDTAVNLDGTQMKFNEVYQFEGVEGTMEQVKLLTGITPQYYMDMGFVDFEKFIDGIGGISANVPISMQLKDIVSGDSISLNPGSQDLGGEEALVLARSRKQYANDLDACRQTQNRQIVQVAIEKVLASPDNAEAYTKVLAEVIDTNMPGEYLSELVADFVANADKVTFVSGTGPYAGDIDPSDSKWYTTRDEGTWSQVIAAVEAGQDPSSIVALPSVSQA